MSYSILIIIIIYFIGCMHLLGLEDRIVLESIFISGGDQNGARGGPHFIEGSTEDWPQFKN